MEYIFKHLQDMQELPDIKIIRNSTVWGYKVILIKLLDGNPVSTISIAQYDLDPKNEAWLYELTTDEKYQNRGFATELIHRALCLCKETYKIDTILLKPDGIDLAIWYCESFGFENYMINDELYLKLVLK